jgi:DNA polymerase-1
MILPVHDEVVFDVPQENVDDACATIKTTMEEHRAFAVPLTVGIDRLEKWGDKYRE